MNNSILGNGSKKIRLSHGVVSEAVTAAWYWGMKDWENKTSLLL